MLSPPLAAALLLLMLSASHTALRAQRPVSDPQLLDAWDRYEISRRALAFLKSAPASNRWDAEWRRVGGDDVMAQLNAPVPTPAPDTVRHRVLLDATATFRTVPPGWPCAKLVEEKARCALRSARFFASVNLPTMSNDTAWVVISLFTSHGATVTSAKTLIAVVREAGGWRPARVLWVRE